MADRPATVRLGGRTTVSIEEFQRLRAALDRGLNRQQLRAWARAELGRGISNDAIRELRSIRREGQAVARSVGRTARNKRPAANRIPSVQSTGREHWQVIGVATIEISPTYVVERQIKFNVSVRPTRGWVEGRLRRIAERMAAGEVDSGGSIRSVAVTTIIHFRGD